MKLNIKSCLVAGMFFLTKGSCSLRGPIGDIYPQNVLGGETVINESRSGEIAVNGISASWRATSSIYNALFLRT